MTIPFYSRPVYTAAPEMAPSCPPGEGCYICTERRRYQAQRANLRRWVAVR